MRRGALCGHAHLLLLLRHAAVNFRLERPPQPALRIDGLVSSQALMCCCKILAS